MDSVRRAQVVTVALPKGGVGKTVTTKELATAAAAAGRRVLAVDLDPQAALSRQVGFDPDDPGGIYPTDGAVWHVGDVLTRSIGVEQALTAHPAGFDLLPADTSLAGVEMALVSQTARELRLHTALEAIAGNYDWIVLDTPPSVNVLWVNAIVAADVIVAPVATDDEGAIRALQALGEHLRDAEPLRAGRRAPTVYAVLTRWRPQTRMSRLAERYVADLGLRIAARIPDRAAVPQAAAQKRTLTTVAPDSPVALAYHQLMTTIDSPEVSDGV